MLKNAKETMFININHIHMVGIGGQGMSGIAEVLLEYGYSISGSDLKRGEKTIFLEEKGAYVSYEHKAENVEGASVVVISSAVKQDNVEVVAAKESGIPVIRRAEMLAEIIRLYRYSICVAGTHGKTTTTSMVNLILKEAHIDPTVIIGGILKDSGANSSVGEGNFIVVEADEYDHSFLKFLPTIAVITNIEADHLDCYKDLDEIKSAFTEFANKIPFYGHIVLSSDNANNLSILKDIEKNYISYGFNSQADIRATEVVTTEFQTQFSVLINQKKVGRVQLNVPGQHNISNALAAISVGKLLDIDFKVMAKALKKYKSVKRRFEIYDTINKITIVDDYAHHPTEVAATLEAAKSSSQGNVIAIFQPHLYSRTKDFCADFAKAFLNADKVILTEIYGARETNTTGITSEIILNAAKDFGHKYIKYIPDMNNIPEYISKIAEPKDIIITMGAGSIYKIAPEIVKNIKEKYEN